MRQWEGKPQDVSRLLTWGCPVCPVMDVKQRENKSKLDPVEPGGDGLYRYMGRAEDFGYRDKGGSIIINSETGEMRSMRNFKVNENIREVREMPWPKPKGEESEEGSDSEEHEERPRRLRIRSIDRI